MPHPAVSTPRQSDFLAVPESPVVYWLSEHLLQTIATASTLGDARRVVKGISTSSESKFIRFYWESSTRSIRWLPYAKGGGYRKWRGLEWYCFDWETDGVRLKVFNSELFGGVHWSKSLRNVDLLGSKGLVCSRVARGSLGFRLTTEDFGFDSTAIFVVTECDEDAQRLLFDLNARVATFVLRSIMPAMVLESGYVGSVPVLVERWSPRETHIVQLCLTLKRHLVATDPTERSFTSVATSQSELDAVATILHTLEGINEHEVFAAYGVEGADMQAVLDETGTPAGFHPLIAGYDALPELPSPPGPLSRTLGEGESRSDGGEGLPPLPQEVVDYLAAHQRIAPPPAELARIKARLRALYEAGPGAKENEETAEGAEAAEGGEDDEGTVSGAHIPIPTETFLEELSVKMQLHPITVYWLLEELRREGARCKPEERRLLEDRLSVLILRLLGHRWPSERMKDEGGRMHETVTPDTSFIPHPSSLILPDEDGIIPLTSGAGQSTLAERVRARLRAEDGEIGAQRAEALLQELTGLILEDWLWREFFKRHVRQFKYRPIAWHLASKPIVPERIPGRRSSAVGRRLPAFECLLYYHACGGDVLARIRTQYVESLLRQERQHLEAARRANQETEGSQAVARIQELEEFNRRLQQVAEQGFASSELDKLLADESLDRWSGDGYVGPATRDDLLRQERAWRVDLNDGVRVNIAPVQLAGLLVSDVLKAADAKKAVADRARWRSDERRWVRAGKLPRCGWMGEDVPESPKWTELAPQREAERVKLEEKRRAVVGEHEQPA